MAATDEYFKLKTVDKDRMFTELFELKEAKAKLDKRIKEIEKEYKPDLEGVQRDLFYELNNGIRFSIKTSQRKGSIDIEAIEEATDIDVDDYRKKPTTVHTLRVDK